MTGCWSIRRKGVESCTADDCCGGKWNVWLTSCSSSFISPRVCANRSLYVCWCRSWSDNVAGAGGSSRPLRVLANECSSSSTERLSLPTSCRPCERIRSSTLWMRRAFMSLSSVALMSLSTVVKVRISSLLATPVSQPKSRLTGWLLTLINNNSVVTG